MIDIEKFICSLLADHPVGVTVREDIHKALKDQGLEYKGGKIVPIEDKPLSKSEDERIRKELLDYLKERDYDVEEEWIAWLEKQGEKKNEVNYVYTKFQIGDIIVDIKPNGNCQPVTVKYIGEGAYSCESVDGKRSLSFPIINQDDYKLVKQNLSWFEKQGKKGTNGNEREIPNSEQKPTYKVEPKFKVGDWVVYCNEDVDLITGIEENGYCINNGGYIPFVCASDIRLWTIKDAKDGDVLFHSDTASNGIFVFKEILQCGTIQKVVCYCDYDSEDGFCLGEKHTCCWTHSKILRPATKEQRDRLFQKMKEAGYEWDADKKELKIIDWSKHIKYEPNSPSITKEYSTWSEDDENMLQSIIATCEFTEQDRDSSPARHLFEMQSNWLNSLRDRVQPKQEWNEEDKNAIQVLKDIVKHSNEINENIYTIPLKEKLYDWLKSLKDRYSWKPSDEQIKVCKKVYADILSAKGFDLGTVNSELNRLEEELKELKAQKGK